MQKKRDIYSARTSELNEEKFEIKLESERLRKAKLRMLQELSYSWQKLQGMILKDRNRKQKERNSEIHDDNIPSTNK